MNANVFHLLHLSRALPVSALKMPQGSSVPGGIVMIAVRIIS